MNDKPICENCLVLPVCLAKNYIPRIGKCDKLKNLLVKTLMVKQKDKIKTHKNAYIIDGDRVKLMRISIGLREISLYSSLRNQSGFRYECEIMLIDNECGQALWMGLKIVKSEDDIIVDEFNIPEIILRYNSTINEKLS